MTIPELVKEIGLNTRAVEKQIAKLQQDDQLKRIGLLSPSKSAWTEKGIIVFLKLPAGMAWI